MYKKELFSYFQSKLKQVRYNFNLALINDPDGIHDLRVEFKRLRGFFKLVESINSDFNAKKNFKDFRKIAKSTNGLRDSHVQQILLKNAGKTLHIDVNAYQNYMKKIEAENLESFRNFSRKNTIENLKKRGKCIKRALKDITPVWAETKARGCIYNMRTNLILLSDQKDLNDKILHNIRILSKETHYILEIIQKCFHKYENAKDFEAGIKKVHQVLGKWHDFDVSITYLDGYVETNGEDISDESYHKLREHLQQEKELLKKSFRAVFDEFNNIASVSLLQ